jgi:hypothetical protein
MFSVLTFFNDLSQPFLDQGFHRGFLTGSYFAGFFMDALRYIYGRFHT